MGNTPRKKDGGGAADAEENERRTEGSATRRNWWSMLSLAVEELCRKHTPSVIGLVCLV
jgi:hypothetical protein